MTWLARALTFLALLVEGTGALGPTEAGAPAVREPVAVTAPEGSHCGEWFSLAESVGWPDAEWPTLDAVMFCESRCDPGARNRSGASGLLQIMPTWWKGRNPFDPWSNLAMGLEVHKLQGWRAWSCYR